MCLKNVSYCRYPTLRVFPTDWSGDLYRARNIILAIKGESFNGYSYVNINGTMRRVDEDRREPAFEWFVNEIADNTQFMGRNLICPIPSSQCTPQSTHLGATMLLADRLAKRFPRLGVWPHLKFKVPMARKTRNERTLFDNMVCTAPVPDGWDVILLDDVCTTGAHARAASRRLKLHGARDVEAISVARTALTADEAIFGYREDQL